MTPEQRAKFILAVLDTRSSGIYPSEEAIAELEPHVEAIRARYAELRSKDFTVAHNVSRAEFIASAIREAENAAYEKAAKRVGLALGGPAHTYASENAELYRAQDQALDLAARDVLSLRHQPEEGVRG